jgi:hypothetical protein
MKKTRSSIGYLDNTLKLKEATWDYQIPRTTPIVFWDSQKDWNETICTKLNHIWAANRPFSGRVKMTVPTKFQPLFENLMFYDQLQKRYEITYEYSGLDMINVGGCILHIINFKSE